MNKILLLLAVSSIVSAGCGPVEKDTAFPETGVRTVLPRVTGQAQWRACVEGPRHPDAVVAAVRCGGELPAHATIEMLERRAAASAETMSDLAAAYYVRAQREHRAVDLLHALRAADDAVAADDTLAAAHFNRALAQEALGLYEEAIASLSRVQRFERDPQWADEALRRQNALMRKVRDAAGLQWPEIEERLRRARDEKTVAALIERYPYAAQMFVETVLLREWADGSRTSLDTARLIARALLRRNGDRYVADVVAAIDGATGKALEDLKQGHRKFSDGVYSDDTIEPAAAQLHYAAAETLFARAGSPARYHAQARQRDAGDPLPYPALEVFRRLRQTYYRLIDEGQFAIATAEYEDIAAECRRLGQPELEVAAETRRGGVLRTLDHKEMALSVGLAAQSMIHDIPSAPFRTAIVAETATTIASLGFPGVARRLRDVHIGSLQAELVGAAGDVRRTLVITRSLGRALRSRADDHVQSGDFAKALRDLEEYAELMPVGAIADQASGAILQMQRLRVLGDAELRSHPSAAVSTFTCALSLTDPEKYRATRSALFLRRVAAWRQLGHGAEAKADLDSALEELEEEEAGILENRRPGEFEWIWSKFLSRSRGLYEQLVRHTMNASPAGAFAYADRGRAFEPLMLILQNGKAPAAFRELVEKSRAVDLTALQRALDPGTFLLEYMVMDDRTLVWIVSRAGIRMLELRTQRDDVAAYAADIEAAVKQWRGRRLLRELDAPYLALIDEPYREIRRIYKGDDLRLVFIADGAMHGLPLGALRNPRTRRHLIQDAIVETAGSATLYVLARQQDAALPRNGPPSALLVLDPAFDPDLDVARGLERLPAAESEKTTIGRQYPVATTLIGAEATVERFIEEARRHTVIQFSGHGRPNAQTPIHSLLLFAPSRSPEHNGVLEGGELLTRLELEATRLVILAACSSAGGAPVGPEGVAPLVRPLVAAGVPAVIGTLWNVEDGKASELLVRFHEHYRLGMDAASALREAQLALLGDENPETGLLAWAPFQVVGHASSPFAPPKPPKQSRSH